MMVESDGTADATRRLNVKKQTLDDAYAVPANFLEIDVVNPLTTMAAGKKRYTDYEVRMRVSRSRSGIQHGGVPSETLTPPKTIDNRWNSLAHSRLYVRLCLACMCVCVCAGDTPIKRTGR